MSGEVRVTVVATGLGRAAQAQKPVQKPKQEAVQQPLIQVVKATGTDGNPDWKRLERPTYERRLKDGEDPIQDQEYLDIPAFLRRQAD
jgi:cell division protein FtsZ